MPRYCAAQDCSNSVWYSGRPAHKFPSEPTLLKLWIRAARPSQPTWKPAKGDCLCTEHFEDDDYKTSPKLLQRMGLPVKKAYLKPGVVPSLFTRKRKRERHSGAVEKRRRKEVSAAAEIFFCLFPSGKHECECGISVVHCATLSAGASERRFFAFVLLSRKVGSADSRHSRAVKYRVC